MKTHRSTQLFLYCSGGEHSVKCVCPALEMEAVKEKQGGVVCFFVAEGAGTRELHRRMSALYVPDKVARVAEEIPRMTHIAARRFAPGRGPSSHYRKPDVIARIDGLNRKNRRMTEEQIRAQVGRGSASVGEVVGPSATYLFLLDWN